MTPNYFKPYSLLIIFILLLKISGNCQIDLFAKYYTPVQTGNYATPYRAVSLSTPSGSIFQTGSADSVNQSGTLLQKIGYDGTVLKTKFLGLGFTYGNYANIATNGSNLIAVTTRGSTYSGNVLVLLDTNLNILSSFGYGTALGYSFLTCIGYHSSGHFFIGGTGLGNAPIALSKVDETGNLLWSKTLLSGDAGDIKVIKQMGDGNLLVAGSIDNRAGALTDAFVLKMTPNGDVLWAAQSKLGDQAQVFDVMEQPYNKGIVAVGSFNTTTGTNSNAFAWQISTSGQSLKTLKLYYYSSTYTKIALMDYGHFMVAGNGQKAFGTSGSMLFTEFDEDLNVTKNHCFDNSVWFLLPNYLKYETNGTITAAFINGMARFDPAFNFIPCLASTCDLDTFSIPGEYNSLQGSSFNYPLTKNSYTTTISDFQLTANTLCDTTVNSVSTYTENVSQQFTATSIFPNPAQASITVVSSEAQHFQSGEIITSNGQTVRTIHPNNLNVPFSIEDLLPGIYFLKINYLNSETEVQKIIKL